MNIVCREKGGFYIALAIALFWLLLVELPNYLSDYETQLGWRITFGVLIAIFTGVGLSNCDKK